MQLFRLPSKAYWKKILSLLTWVSIVFTTCSSPNGCCIIDIPSTVKTSPQGGDKILKSSNP